MMSRKTDETLKSTPSMSHLEIKPISEEFVYYESIDRELKRRPTYEYRCDERLKTKSVGSTLLGYVV